MRMMIRSMACCLLLGTACNQVEQVGQATLDAAAEVLVYAMAKVHHAPHLADVPGGLPLVIVQGRPIAGQPWRCGWTTRPTAPFVEADALLLITYEAPPAPQLIPFGGGGMLMVPIDRSIRPRDGTMLTQHGGYIEANVTFPSNLVGLRMWMQLIVRDARAGITVSPMLEVMVGTR